jgi:hypothetical protein
MFNWYVLFSGLAGALVGGLFTAGVHLWKFGRDEFSARCDELSKALIEAGNAAADYWAKEFKENEIDKARASEARLLGMQAMIDGLAQLVIDRFRKKDRMELQDRLADMTDALTGGRFSEAGRPFDAVRTSQGTRVAGELTGVIRRGHRNTMPRVLLPFLLLKWPFVAAVALGTIAAIAGATYWGLRWYMYGQHLAMVEVIASVNPEQCPDPTKPIRVLVQNGSKKAVNAVKFEIIAYRVGHSTDVTNPRTIVSDQIIKASESLTLCEPNELKRDVRGEDLGAFEWRISDVDALFAE